MLPNLLSKLFSVDERFIMHRYHSTRWAVIVGMVLMAAWVNYEYFVNHNLHIDLIVIMLVMAVTKVAAMVYLQRTH